MKEYKLTVLPGKWKAGRLDVPEMERSLNELAQQGWRVISQFLQEEPGLFSNRREFCLLLERDTEE